MLRTLGRASLACGVDTADEGVGVYPGRHAVDNPDQAAIIMATSGETVTYAEYERHCNQLAHLMRDAGLQRGDHISVFMENQPRMLEIEGAAERIGLYYTLVNSYLAADEVAYIVTNSRSRMFLSSTAKRQVAEEAARACPQLERLLMVGLDGPFERWEPYAAAVAPWHALFVGHHWSAEGHPAPASITSAVRCAAGHAVRALLVWVPRGHDLPQPGALVPLGAASQRGRVAPPGRHRRGDGALRPRAVARPGGTLRGDALPDGPDHV